MVERKGRGGADEEEGRGGRRSGVKEKKRRGKGEERGE